MVFAFARNKRLSLVSLANSTNGLHSARVVWAHTRVSPSTRVLAAVSAVGLVLLGIAIGLDVRDVDVPVSYAFLSFKLKPLLCVQRTVCNPTPPQPHTPTPNPPPRLGAQPPTPFPVRPNHLGCNTTTPHPTSRASLQPQGVRWLYFWGSICTFGIVWNILVDLVYTWIEVRPAAGDGA